MPCGKDACVDASFKTRSWKLSEKQHCSHVKAICQQFTGGNVVAGRHSVAECAFKVGEENLTFKRKTCYLLCDFCKDIVDNYICLFCEALLSKFVPGL